VDRICPADSTSKTHAPLHFGRETVLYSLYAASSSCINAFPRTCSPVASAWLNRQAPFRDKNIIKYERLWDTFPLGIQWIFDWMLDTDCIQSRWVNITFEYLRWHCFAVENRLGYQWFAQVWRELRPSKMIKRLPVKSFPMCNLLCHSALSFMFRSPVGDLTVLLHCQDWWVEEDQYHHLRELTLEQYLISHLEHLELAFFLHTRQVESAKMSRARLRTPIKSQRRT